MKKISIKILSLCMLSFLTYSCIDGDADDMNFKTYEANSLHFESEEGKISELVNEAYALVVYYSSPNHNSKITAEVMVDGDVSQIEYTKTLTFEPGVYSDTIYIKPIDNFLTDGNKKYEFKLKTPVENVTIGYAGESQFNSTFSLTVLDNDCAFNPTHFEGIPTGEDIYNGTPFPSQVKFTLLSKEEENGATVKAIYEVTGLMLGQLNKWEEPVNKGGTFQLELDSTDPTNPKVRIVSVNEDPYGLGRDDFYVETTGNGADWAYFIHLDETGSNTFSTCNETITFKYIVDVLNVTTNDYYEADATNVLSIKFK